MDYLYLFLLKFYTLGLAFFIYFILRYTDKAAIIEVGYRSKTEKKKMKAGEIHLSRWNRFLFWNITRNTKQNHKIAWIYFGLHILSCIGLLVSICLFLYPTSIDDWRNGLTIQLYLPLGVFMVHTGLRFVLDLLFLPSEQRRYRINKKQ